MRGIRQHRSLGVGRPTTLVTYTNLPTQPMRYHYDGSPLSSWAHPGALVIAGFGRSDLGPPAGGYEGTDPGYVTAANAGACVIAYIDPIIDNAYGLYHELLHHQYDTLGRTVGAATSRWPGNHQANEFGYLADFRVGSTLQAKWGAVLETMLDDCPWLAGFWIDDCGSRSWYPDFDWNADLTATDRQNYRDGAIALIQTAREICDRRRAGNGRKRIIIVNGTWNGGTLSANGGGYPNMSLHGCSLVEGAEIEHHDLDQFWIDYASSSQWATEASTGGVPFIVTSCETNAIQTDFRNAGIVSHSENAEANSSVWGSFHETGLPDNRGA